MWRPLARLFPSRHHPPATLVEGERNVQILTSNYYFYDYYYCYFHSYSNRFKFKFSPKHIQSPQLARDRAQTFATKTNELNIENILCQH
jgi:hypothetical protein